MCDILAAEGCHVRKIDYEDRNARRLVMTLVESIAPSEVACRGKRGGDEDCGENLFPKDSTLACSIAKALRNMPGVSFIMIYGNFISITLTQFGSTRLVETTLHTLLHERLSS